MNERESVCQKCGRTFRYQAATTPRKYCDDCKTSAYKEVKRKGTLASFRRLAGITPWIATCSVCGREYETARKERVTCGDPQCMTEWKRRKDRRREHENGHLPMDEWKAKLESQHQETEERRQKERAARIQTKICIVCGNEFRTSSKSKTTCSDECSEENTRRKQRIAHRIRDRKINGSALVDKDIDLERLYERDNGICYICGEVCDWKDRHVVDGYFTAGKLYPSIDHVVPLARGGKHSWDNVRLAHRICNSKKSDNDPSLYVDTMEIPDAYKMKRYIRPNTRGVRQYTLSKELIAVFDSMNEAERKTGIPSRGIQKCAAGRCRSSHGFIWEYAN